MSVTVCDEGRGGKNVRKKRYIIIERPQTIIIMSSDGEEMDTTIITLDY